jgi:hypothetical protein
MPRGACTSTVVIRIPTRRDSRGRSISSRSARNTTPTLGSRCRCRVLLAPCRSANVRGGRPLLAEETHPLLAGVVHAGEPFDHAPILEGLVQASIESRRSSVSSSRNSTPMVPECSGMSLEGSLSARDSADGVTPTPVTTLGFPSDATLTRTRWLQKASIPTPTPC